MKRAPLDAIALFAIALVSCEVPTEGALGGFVSFARILGATFLVIAIWELRLRCTALSGMHEVQSERLSNLRDRISEIEDDLYDDDDGPDDDPDDGEPIPEPEPKDVGGYVVVTLEGRKGRTAA